MMVSIYKARVNKHDLNSHRSKRYHLAPSQLHANDLHGREPDKQKQRQRQVLRFSRIETFSIDGFAQLKETYFNGPGLCDILLRDIYNHASCMCVYSIHMSQQPSAFSVLPHPVHISNIELHPSPCLGHFLEAGLPAFL
jgi:hypothetical protein